MRLPERLEYSTGQDPALNYCLWEYSRATPSVDKFRSVNLLYQSFDHAGVDARAYAIVEAIRDAIGPFRTVFGVKQLPDRLAWEYYFYDYRRREREVSISRAKEPVDGRKVIERLGEMLGPLLQRVVEVDLFGQNLLFEQRWQNDRPGPRALDQAGSDRVPVERGRGRNDR